MGWRDWSYAKRGGIIGLIISIIASVLSLITFGYGAPLFFLPVNIIFWFFGIEAFDSGTIFVIFLLIGFLIYPLIGYIIGGFIGDRKSKKESVNNNNNQQGVNIHKQGGKIWKRLLWILFILIILVLIWAYLEFRGFI